MDPIPQTGESYVVSGHFGNEQALEDNGNEATNRFLNAKASRKKIELDAMALKNRILLLENEENKVMKKIEETKRKALQIIEIKARNRDHEQEQTAWRNWNQETIEQRHEMVERERSDLQKAVDIQREEYLFETKAKADETKNNLQKLRERYKIQKKEEHIHNIQSVNNIRLFEKELESSKRYMLEQIQSQARTRYESSIMQEERKKDSVLGEIDNLERKEQTLIARLKITQTQHQNAMTDLDRINKNQEPIGLLLETKLAWEKRTPNRRRFQNSKKSLTPNAHRNY